MVAHRREEVDRAVGHIRYVRPVGRRDLTDPAGSEKDEDRPLTVRRVGAR